MAYRFEMHFHTAESSPCGNVPAAEGVAAYRERGYRGMVVTDHYADYQFEGREGCWEEKIRRWRAGYRAAKAAGDALGMVVLSGMELRLAGFNEYLVYGVTEQQLLAYPALYRLDIHELREMARACGWFVAQAHPCRPHMTLCPPDCLEGVEVFNGNKRHDSHNAEAAAFCEANGLIGVSGSDFHEWEDLARGGVVFEEDIRDETALLRALRERAFTLLRPGGDAVER